MINSLRNNIKNIILNTELKEGDKEVFYKFVDSLSFKALNRLYSVLIVSRQKQPMIFEDIKNRIILLNVISKNSFLSAAQKQQLKKNVFILNTNGLRKLKTDLLSGRFKKENIVYIKKDLILKINDFDKKLKKVLSSVKN